MRRMLRFKLRSADAAETFQNNKGRKQNERARRRERMITLLKAGNPPYPPGVMSWLCAELGKKSRHISQDDVKAIIA